MCVGTVVLALAVSMATAQTTKPQDNWPSSGKDLFLASAKDSPTDKASETAQGTRQEGDWRKWDDRLAFADAKGSSGEKAGESQPAAEPAREPDPQSWLRDKPFELTLKPNFWIPSYKGKAVIAGHAADIDVSLNDMLQLLDEVECIVPINLEARWKNWGVSVDVLYVKLEDRITMGPITVKPQLEQEILELAGFYRLGVWPVGTNAGRLSLDILGGARYNRMQGDVGLLGGRGAVNVSGTQEWWDLFIGPRIIYQPCEKFRVFVRGDVGGFGIEGSSKFTWQTVAGARYDITKNIFVEAGYRVLDIDYGTGSGNHRFEWDVQMRGPFLALGIAF
jgi:hypothetical protein